MYSMNCKILTLVLIACVSATTSQTIDYCRFDITNNLEGRAYPIDQNQPDVGLVFKEEFVSRLSEEKIKKIFIETFGQNAASALNELNDWCYDFAEIGRINMSSTLPVSLHCTFLAERDIYFPHIYSHRELETTSIVNFLVNRIFNYAMRECPLKIRLPLFVVNYNNALACNFGTINSKDREFFILHCVHNIMDSQTPMTTKIVEKWTTSEMCVSDVEEACDKTLDIDVRSNDI